MTKRIFLVVLAFVLAGIGIYAIAQASFPLLSTTEGAAVNGKPSFIPTTQTVDTQTAVAAGTLNGENSPEYDVSQLTHRMVNVSFDVTAVPGTSPSLTPSVQESDDGGATWYTVVAQDGSTFSAVTTTGTVTGKNFPIFGNLLRIHYAASGSVGDFSFTAAAEKAQ